MARVVIADAEFVVRMGCANFSETRDLELTADAATAEELHTLLRSEPFDLVLIELTLGSRSGVDVLKQIKSELPALPVLVFTSGDEQFFATWALRAGASGYVQKRDAPQALLDAMRRLLRGGTYLSERMLQSVAASLARSQANLLPHECLSEREFEVFRMLGTGRTVSEIARALNLSVKTVSTHRTRILEKTGCAGNADIVAYVTAHRLVD